MTEVNSVVEGEKQKISGEYLDLRVIAAFHANFGDGDDEMLEKVKTLRARLDEMGAFFFAT